MAISTTPTGRALLRALSVLPKDAEGFSPVPSGYGIATVRRLAKARLVDETDGRRARLTDAGRARLEWHRRRSLETRATFGLPAPARRPSTSDRTYQERGAGISTPEELRLSSSLLVSDLGTYGTSFEERDSLPAGVVFYQVVDCHNGYAAGETALLAAGFGAARDWALQGARSRAELPRRRGTPRYALGPAPRPRGGARGPRPVARLKIPS